MKKKFKQNVNLSFRGRLQTKISAFTFEFEQPLLTASLLAELILGLSTCHQEDSKFFPVVFVGETLEDVLAISDGTDPISIGSASQTREHIQRACQLCAPLADDHDWAIYITLKSRILKYGIFRLLRSFDDTTPFEKLKQSIRPTKVIGLSGDKENQFRLFGACGLFKLIKIPYASEKIINPEDAIQSLVKAITKDSPKKLKSHLESFYSCLGTDLLNSNQGLLIAVIPHQKTSPPFFRDGILFESKINIVKKIPDDLMSNAKCSFQNLSAWNNLIRRMAAMDGITVLDSSGAVVGYNCFLKDSTVGIIKSTASFDAIRRRSFELLRSHLGNQLVGVIYRSHDGILDLGVSDAN